MCERIKAGESLFVDNSSDFLGLVREIFKEYYEKDMFHGLYTTNLSYIPEEYKKEKWLHVCDCSDFAAQVIYNMHNDISISALLTDKSKPIKLLEKKFKEVNK